MGGDSVCKMLDVHGAALLGSLFCIRNESVKASLVLFSVMFLPAFAVSACPIGMVFDGNGCSPPPGWNYSMDDYIRERYEAIDRIGSDHDDSASGTTYARPLTPEELAEAQRLLAEKEKRESELAIGQWTVNSLPTPDGKLCTAVFAKFKTDASAKDQGIVGIMGLQQSKKDAWLIFYGADLPKPQKVKKVNITLQQNDEPAYTVKAFNYRLSKHVGTIALSVPGLAAALGGMSDKQSFKVRLGGRVRMSIQWTNGASGIQQLQNCAR